MPNTNNPSSRRPMMPNVTIGPPLGPDYPRGTLKRRRRMAEAALKTNENFQGNARAEVQRVLDRVKSEGRTSLTAPEGKIVCDAYGIPVPKEGVATSAQDATKLAEGMGFPVVMKIVSPDILHKTEAGGVLVGVKSAEEVAKGYETILANAKNYNASAKKIGRAHV